MAERMHLSGPEDEPDRSEPAHLDVALLRRVSRFTAGHRAAMAAIVGLTSAVGIFGALEPMLLRHVVDGLAAGGPGRALLVGVAGLAVIAVLRELTAAAGNWLSWRVRLRIHHRLLSAAVDRLHGVSLAYHRNQPVGSLMTKLDRSIQGIVSAFTELAFNVLPAIAFLAFAMSMMVRLEWRLSLMLFALIPVPALLGAWAAPRQTRRDHVLLDRWSRIYARFNEVLGAILTVKSFAMEREEQRRFLQQVDEANRIVIGGVGFDARLAAMQNVVGALTRVAVLGWGGYLVLEGRMTVGTLLAFTAYLSGLFGPVQGLTNAYQTIRRASVSLRAYFAIADAPEDVRDDADARSLDVVRGEVTLDRVSFGYRSGQPVLTDVSLHVRAGETVALVGPSGGGKTTLAVLLQRLYDPQHGSIRIDGVDVRRLTQRSLRKNVGVVLQDAVLFNDTIAANIAYGRPDATRAQIEAAARAACAHDFVMAMPKGYDTEVGERGNLLSAGQRQRIAIARTLLKDPPVVILDEATSALDAESESLVEAALARLLRGRTTFVIAHRLATVVRADKILVLRGGRIVEAGTHRNLVASGGYYASLVEKQTRGLIDANDGGEQPRWPVAA